MNSPYTKLMYIVITYQDSWISQSGAIAGLRRVGVEYGHLSNFEVYANHICHKLVVI